MTKIRICAESYITYTIDVYRDVSTPRLQLVLWIIHPDLVEHVPRLVVGMDLAARDKMSEGNDDVAPGPAGEARAVNLRIDRIVFLVAVGFFHRLLQLNGEKVLDVAGS